MGRRQLIHADAQRVGDGRLNRLPVHNAGQRVGTLAARATQCAQTIFRDAGQNLVRLGLGDGAIGHRLGNGLFDHGLCCRLHVCQVNTLLIGQCRQRCAFRMGRRQLIHADAQRVGDGRLNRLPVHNAGQRVGTLAARATQCAQTIFRDAGQNLVRLGLGDGAIGHRLGNGLFDHSLHRRLDVRQVDAQFVGQRRQAFAFRTSRGQFIHADAQGAGDGRVNRFRVHQLLPQAASKACGDAPGRGRAVIARLLRAHHHYAGGQNHHHGEQNTQNRC